MQPAGFFAMRSPLLAFDALRDWGAAAATDRQVLSERLMALWRQPAVREAVFLASPELDAALERGAPGDSHDKALRGLLAYVSRMAARPTPFGLFAGVSTGALQRCTHLELPSANTASRRTRLDMDYLSGLVAALERDLAVRETLR